MQEHSNIISISEKRRERNKRTAQAVKPEAVRILELEVDVARLVDLLDDTQQRLDALEKIQGRILDLLVTSRRHGRRR